MFGYERELVTPAQRWLASIRTVTRRELETAVGTCDLAGCSFYAHHAAKRRAQHRSRTLGPPARVDIWSRIPERGRGMFLDDLLEACAALGSSEYVQSELSKLSENRFITAGAQGRFLRDCSWYPLHRAVTAIELKLYKVAEALRQAHRYRSFADEVYVGLPCDTAPRIARSRRAEFYADGVGLLSIDHSDVRVLIRPRSANPSPVDTVAQIHVVERFWRDYLAQTPHH
jgi:hypothetical protein